MYEETRITSFQTSSKFMAIAGTESTVGSHCAKGRQGSLLVGSSGAVPVLSCFFKAPDAVVRMIPVNAAFVKKERSDLKTIVFNMIMRSLKT